MTVSGLLGRWATWTARQSLGPTSLSGVSLVLAACAAAWFTAGTRSGNVNGGVALAVCYLAAFSARYFAGQARGYTAASLARLTAAAQPAAGTSPSRARTSAWQAALFVRLESIARSGWLAGLGMRVSDGAILAGLAVGVMARGRPAVWPLAISVLALIAVRDTMTACSRPPAEPERANSGKADSGLPDEGRTDAGPTADGGAASDSGQPGRPGGGWLRLVQRSVGTALTMPFGGRVLLVAVAAPVWGARASLQSLLDWGIVAIGYGIVAGTVARRQRRPRTKARRFRRTRREPGGLAVLLEPPRPPAWAELHAARSAQQIPVLGIRLSPAPGGASLADPEVAPPAPVGGLADIGLAAPDDFAPEFADPILTDAYLTDADLAAEDWADGGLADRRGADPYLSAAGLADAYLTEADLGDRELADAGVGDAGSRYAGAGFASAGYPDPGLADAGFAPAEPADPGRAEAGVTDVPLGGGDLGSGATGRTDAGPAEGSDAVPPAAARPREDRRAAAGRAADPAPPLIVRCRDDGVISRWFGRLVRGQLMPLPAALLALAGVALLAQLGLSDLPGILIFAPGIVMLVAAPGSSHRHSGPLDWLVPALLQGAQYIYITALGLAARVPVAVIFLLCAAIALRYADLGCPSSPPFPPRHRGRSRPGQDPAGATAPSPAEPGDGPPERGTWMGWEGRMLICGLGAAMGIAMFAYLALAAYLGGLICGKILHNGLAVPGRVPR